MPTDYDTYKPEWIDEDKREDKKYASFVMGGITQAQDELRLSSVAAQSSRPPQLSVDDYVEGVLSGDRMKLARAITMVESNAPRHFQQGQELIRRLSPYAGRSVRLGVTGVPGAGKSTLIEALGMHLINDGHKVAVLAVDPSSSVSRGAILGDKTRMEHLSREANAFIRPSPTGGALGGVTRKSRETILLCEAAGFDTILVETVGVGQSETTVRAMVDFFLVLVLTGAGDELQGIKKGVIELADAIFVNKADGDNQQKALVARSEYEQILHYLRPATQGWQPHAYTCSALTGVGIAELWQVVADYCAQMQQSGQLQARRKEQDLAWVRQMSEDYLRELLNNDTDFAAHRQAVEAKISNGELTPTAALAEIVSVIQQKWHG